VCRCFKKQKASKADRQFHLKLLVHFIGDLHQPMHLAKKEDRGGNEVSIKWFGKRSNLHRLWDSDMIDSSQLSYTELAQNLTVLSPAQKAQIVSGSLSVWVAEIHELTKKVYQELPENTNLGYRYRYQNFDRFAFSYTRQDFVWHICWMKFLNNFAKCQVNP
jgi:hypothetical protein